MRKSPDLLNKKDLAKHAQWLKVLAHPTRLAIVNALLPGPQCVNDVCDLCDASQPNISQHLALLRHAGIVKFYDEGKLRCYFLPYPNQIQAILAALSQKEPEFKPDCCPR
jgi:ArsR family transcriptional regulator, arsenate/arsenite/antimonite-responsive transcriptional repressor